MLVRTPPPFPTESFFGYLLRVAEANGYLSPGSVLRCAGIERHEVGAALPAAKLAAILGRDTAEIESISYVAHKPDGQRTFKVLKNELGGSLTERQLRLKSPGICPHCIEADKYVDAFFDLSFAIACPTHKCLVITTCSACDRPVHWCRPGLLTCRCGTSYSTATAMRADNAVIDLMALLKAMVHSEPIAAPGSSSVYVALLTMPLRSVLAALRRLGEFDLLSRGIRGGTDTDIIRSAASVLSNWPVSYHEFLLRLGAHYKSTRSQTFGLRKSFEPFYLSMFEKSSFSTHTTFFRDEFLRFGLATWGEAVITDKVAERSHCVERRFYSESGLAREVGVCRATIARWAEKGLLPVRLIQVGPEKRYVLDAQELALAKQAPGQILEVRHAAARLGIPVSVLNALRRTGTFPVLSMPRHKKGVHEVDLQNFLNAMLKVSPLTERNCLPDDAISLYSILRNVRLWTADGKAHFCASYLRGTLKSVGRVGLSTQEIFFMMEDVQRFAATQLMSDTTAALSCYKASKIIGCTHIVVPQLMRQGYLTGHRKGKQTLVSVASIRTFVSRYILLTSLARELSTNVSQLTRICKSTNIPYLSLSHNRKCLSPFIARRDEEALRQRIACHLSDRAKRMSRSTCVAKLRRYLEDLRERRTPLPRRSGRPNTRAIARACGFDRNVVYRNADVRTLLAAFNAEDGQRESTHEASG